MNLYAGVVHLRLSGFPADPAEQTRLTDLITPEERKRAERLLDREQGTRRAAARGVLREILAEYLGVAPEGITIATGEHGKPFVPGAGIHFNLSHSGDLILIALAQREIGIDLEAIRSDLPWEPLARQFFSPGECAALFSLSPSDRLAAFYRIWTRKEAYLKGVGSGFSRSCSEFEVSSLPGEYRLLRHRTAPEETARWALIDLPLPAGFAAALAFPGAPPEIELFSPR